MSDKPKKIIWNADPGSLDLEQLQSIRSAIHEVNPWQSLISCVDGRELEIDGDYVQTLGGELQSILWIQFCMWHSGEEIPFKKAFKLNNEFHHRSHLRIGIHSGPHAQPQDDVTDCGYADNLLTIVEALGQNGHEIRALLNHGAHTNGLANFIDHTNEDVWHAVTHTAQRIVERAKSDDAHAFLKSTEMFQAEVEVAGEYGKAQLVGDHREQFAHVNLAAGTSANTHQLNEMELAGFNLDLWYAMEVVAKTEAFESLGCDQEFLKLLTLGLYQSTERVLRPNKSPLPIVITENTDL